MKNVLVLVALLALMSLVAAGPPVKIPGHAVAAENRGERSNGGGKKGFKAETELTGDQEVPPNDSEAEGRFEIQFNCNLTEARFELDVEADRVLQAHLHCGLAEANGPVVVFLFGMFPGGVDVDGTLSAFTLTQANLDAVNSDCTNAIGYSIETMADLAHAIEAGEIYANVHTVAFPPGEIRGQLEPSRRQSRCVDHGDDDDHDDNDNTNGNDNDNGNDNHDHGG